MKIELTEDDGKNVFFALEKWRDELQAQELPQDMDACESVLNMLVTLERLMKKFPDYDDSPR